MSQDVNNSSKPDGNQIDTSGFTFSFPAQFPTEVNQSSDNKNSGFTFTFPDSNGGDTNGFNFSNAFFQNSNNSTTDTKDENSTNPNSEQSNQQTHNSNINGPNQSSNFEFNPFGSNASTQNLTSTSKEAKSEDVSPSNNDQECNKDSSNQPNSEQPPQQANISSEDSPNQFNPFSAYIPSQNSNNSINENKEIKQDDNQTNHENKSNEDRPMESVQKGPEASNNSNASDLDIFLNISKDQPSKQPATINAFDLDFDIPQTAPKIPSTGGIPNAKIDFDNFFNSVTSPSSKLEENTSQTKKMVDDLFADFQPPKASESTENSNVSQPNHQADENINEDKKENEQANSKDGNFGDFPAHLSIPKRDDSVPSSFGGFADPSTKEDGKKKDDEFNTFTSVFNDKSNSSEAKSFGGFAFTDSVARSSNTEDAENKKQDTKPVENNESDQETKNSNDLFASFPAALAKSQNKAESNSTAATVSGGLGGFSFADPSSPAESAKPTEKAEEDKEDADNKNDLFASFPAALSKTQNKTESESTTQAEANGNLGGFTFSDPTQTTSQAGQKNKDDDEDDNQKNDSNNVFASFPAALSNVQNKIESAASGGLGGFSFSDPVKPTETSESITENSKKDSKEENNDNNDNEEKENSTDAFASFPAALAKTNNKQKLETPSSMGGFGGFSFTDSAAPAKSTDLGGFSFSDSTAPVQSAKPADKFEPEKEEEDKDVKNGGNDVFSSFPAALSKSHNKEESESSIPANSEFAFSDSAPPAKSVDLGGFSFTDSTEAPAPTASNNGFGGFTFADPTPASPSKTEEDQEKGEANKTEQPNEAPSNAEVKDNDKESDQNEAKTENDEDDESPNPFAAFIPAATQKADHKESELATNGENGAFAFSFTPSFGISSNESKEEGESAKKEEETKTDDSKNTTEPNFADFSGFSFTSAENNAGFTFNFPDSNASSNANDENAADGEDGNKSISFGNFNPFGGGFTFTPATPESAKISKEAETESAEKPAAEQQQTEKVPRRKIRGSNFNIGNIGKSAAEEEAESYKGVPLGDTSYDALQNLLLNPIFKQEKIDFKEYYDKPDETDTLDGALEFLKSHASK